SHPQGLAPRRGNDGKPGRESVPFHGPIGGAPSKGEVREQRRAKQTEAGGGVEAGGVPLRRRRHREQLEFSIAAVLAAQAPPLLGKGPVFLVALLCAFQEGNQGAEQLADQGRGR